MEGNAVEPKKPSLIHRLFIRNREGGHPLAMEPSGERESVENGRGASVPSGSTALAEPPERLSKKEETAIRIQEGFQDLSSLLKTIGQKLDVQNGRGLDLAEQVRPLPPLLHRLSEQLELGRETSIGLRDSLKGLETASNAQIDFLRKVDSNHRQMVETFDTAQKRALNVFYKAQKETYEVFRKHQESQSRQFEDIMVKTQKSFTKMLVIFFVAILVAVSAAVVVARGAAPVGEPSAAPAIEREGAGLPSDRPR